MRRSFYRRRVNSSSSRRRNTSSTRRRTGSRRRSIGEFVSDTRKQIRKNPVAVSAIGTALGLGALSVGAYVLLHKRLERKVARQQEEAIKQIETVRNDTIKAFAETLERERIAGINQAELQLNECVKNAVPNLLVGVNAAALIPYTASKNYVTSWINYLRNLVTTKGTTPTTTSPVPPSLITGGGDDATCDVRTLEPFLRLNEYFRQLYYQDYDSFLVLYSQFVDGVLLQLKH